MTGFFQRGKVRIRIEFVESYKKQLCWKKFAGGRNLGLFILEREIGTQKFFIVLQIRIEDAILSIGLW